MAMTAPAVGFDTLSYARRLKDAGVDDVQAEAHAEAVRDAITEAVATKADVARLEDRMKGLEDKMDGMATKTELDKGLVALKVDFDKGLAALRVDLDKGLAALGADLDKLEARVDRKMANLETGMANLETRLVRNIYTVSAAQIVIIVGLTVSLLKLFP